MRTYPAWRQLLGDEVLPAAVLDLDALDHNQDVLLGALGAGLTLRIASKSIRVPAVLRYLLDRGGDRMRGVMTFSAYETAFLAEEGFDDLLLAYPIGRPDEAVALARAAMRTTVRCVIDDVAQARHLSAAAEGAGVTLQLILDIDASWRPGRGAHFGVRRSPLRTGAQAVALAQACADLPAVTLGGIMAYEAQVASLPDAPGGRLVDVPIDVIKRTIKARSIPLVAARRREVVTALHAAGWQTPLVNGGGTGSMASTSADPTITEVTAGSGFPCPHLFDGFDRLPLKPALFFALGVVRSSDPDHVTCAGGGYIASGAPGSDRLPQVHAPTGLTPLPMEGFGEVQTPFHRGEATPPLHLGDPVICRHAKAGELAERFAHYALVRGDAVVERVPTYRGAGRTFF